MSLFLYLNVYSCDVCLTICRLNIKLCTNSAFNAHALGALAEVAGPSLYIHLGTVLPALLSAMGGDDEVSYL